jgi:hypothetical protein
LRPLDSGKLTVSLNRGHETISAMIDHGWYVAPDRYRKIVGELERFGD